MANKAIWGIDISGRSVKAVRLRGSKTGVELTHVDSMTLPDTGDDEDLFHEAVRHTLQGLFEKNNITNKDGLVLSIPGSSTFNRPVSLPPLGDPKKLREIVEYEAQQYIPFPISEVVWDYHLLNPDEFEDGGEAEVLLFAVRREVIQPYLDLMAEKRLDLRVLQTNPVATYNFIHYDIQPESAIVTLDIGAETTSLIIVNGDNFWIRNLPIAGDEITKRLQKKLKLSYEEAERLKRTMNESKQAAKIFKVIEPTLKELVGEVHRSMGYYKSQAGGVKFTHLLILGSGSNVYGLTRYFENQLQLKVSRVKNFQRIDVSPTASKVLSGAKLPGYTTSVGLALQGLGVGSSNVNFLPSQLLETRQAAKQKPLYLVGAVLALIAVILLAMKSKDDLATLKTKASPLKALTSTLQTCKEHCRVESQFATLEQSLDTLASFMPDRTYHNDYLGKIMSTLTDNYAYTMRDGQYDLEKKGDWDWYLYPEEKDRFYCYNIQYTILRKTAEKGGGRMQSGSVAEFPLVELEISGSLLKLSDSAGPNEHDRWVETRIVKQLREQFPASVFPSVRVVRDNKPDPADIKNHFHDFRWDPDPDKSSFDEFSPEPDPDGRKYFFFTATVQFPLTHDFYSLYVDLFDEKMSPQTRLGRGVREVVDPDGARVFAVKEIVKQYNTLYFKTWQKDERMKVAYVLASIQPYLATQEMNMLYNEFGISVEMPEDTDATVEEE